MKAAAVVGLFYKDNKFLMVSRKSGLYGLLGGKIEENETTYQALVREVAEESGIKVKDGIPFFVRFDGNCETHCFYITDYNAPNPLVSPEGLDLQWFDYKDAIKNSEFKEYNVACIKCFRERFKEVNRKVYSSKSFTTQQRKDICNKMAELILPKIVEEWLGECYKEHQKETYINELSYVFDSEFLSFDAYQITKHLDDWSADIDLVHILEGTYMYFDEAVESVIGP